jgi:serine/threonine-protein kinase RsbW
MMSDVRGLSETLTDDLAEIGRLAEKVDDVLGDHGVPMAEIFRINLAIEELVTNAVLHGFGGTGKGNTLRVGVSVTGGVIETVIEDDGPAFNPFTVAAVDTALPLEDREIGGLGIHLARECMDEVAYQRLAAGNRVTLRRCYHRIDAPEAAGAGA